VPGVSRGTRPLGSVWATGIVTHPRWDRVSASDFDIAMMRLDTAVLPAADCLTPAVGIQPSTALSPPRIIGYPYVEVHGDTPVEGQGAIRAVESNRLFYDIDTEGGQSGAPILVPAASGRSVVLGLHCGGLGNGASALANSYNAGIHLRKELTDWMGTSGT
jgi:glutamyl endopeptidase